MNQQLCLEQELFKHAHSDIVSLTVFILSSAALSYLTSNVTEEEDA